MLKLVLWWCVYWNTQRFSPSHVVFGEKGYLRTDVTGADPQRQQFKQLVWISAWDGLTSVAVGRGAPDWRGSSWGHSVGDRGVKEMECLVRAFGSWEKRSNAEVLCRSETGYYGIPRQRDESLLILYCLQLVFPLSHPPPFSLTQGSQPTSHQPHPRVATHLPSASTKPRVVSLGFSGFVQQLFPTEFTLPWSLPPAASSAPPAAGWGPACFWLTVKLKTPSLLLGGSVPLPNRCGSTWALPAASHHVPTGPQRHAILTVLGLQPCLLHVQIMD